MYLNIYILAKAINLDEHARNSTVAVNISVVDLNDNAPYFNRRSYDANVLENTTLGKVVLVLNKRQGSQCKHQLHINGWIWSKHFQFGQRLR